MCDFNPPCVISTRRVRFQPAASQRLGDEVVILNPELVNHAHNVWLRLRTLLGEAVQHADHVSFFILFIIMMIVMCSSKWWIILCITLDVRRVGHVIGSLSHRYL